MRLDEKMLSFIVAGLLFCPVAFCQDSGKSTLPRVVVLDFETDGQIDSEQSAAMADSLSSAMKKSRQYDVVDRKEFKKALRAHEQKTGKPCKDMACINMVARSLGAHPVKTSLKKDGNGCSVRVGMVGGNGKNIASGSLKRPCSPTNYRIAAEGAVMFMTNEVNRGTKINDIDMDRERQALSISEQPAKDPEEQLDDEFDAAVEDKHDTKAEQNAKKLEQEARRKLGLGK